MISLIFDTFATVQLKELSVSQPSNVKQVKMFALQMTLNLGGPEVL